ncbi:MAG: family transcriptional regulator [Pedosphaera sp.]|nr:family transcriptional regulator [Pedosphaera sp.]
MQIICVRIMKSPPKHARRFRSYADIPKTYGGLCKLLLPRPIHDAVDYANVVEVTDAMVLWCDDFTRDQTDYFDLLCSLIEEYDAKHVKWPKVTGLDALKHLLDEQNLAAADLSRLLGGSRNLGSMILRGERKLTLNHVRTLAKRFHISADLFLG